MKIGITGSNGFIGSHLIQRLSIERKDYEIITCKREFFHDDRLLDEFILKCDKVIHLAGINRSDTETEIYQTNIELAEKLSDSILRTKNLKKLIFTSSIQEINESTYGRSKRVARNIFKNKLSKTNCTFHGVIIPNVFGPFGIPYYNSVIATFCDQLCKGKIPSIISDKVVDLIYIDDLIKEIILLLDLNESNPFYLINHTDSLKVSEILAHLNDFMEVYYSRNTIPNLLKPFKLNLFNTFRSYIDYSNYFPRSYKVHTDDRGSFTEIIRSKNEGQSSFSITKPGIVRGNHFHTRKIERFSVIKGEALISIRKIDSSKVIQYKLCGENPSYVDIPIWYTHNIKNIGTSDLYTCFWINESYDPLNPDTYYENV